MTEKNVSYAGSVSYVGPSVGYYAELSPARLDSEDATEPAIRVVLPAGEAILNARELGRFIKALESELQLSLRRITSSPDLDASWHEAPANATSERDEIARARRLAWEGRNNAN